MLVFKLRRKFFTKSLSGISKRKKKQNAHILLLNFYSSNWGKKKKQLLQETGALGRCEERKADPLDGRWAITVMVVCKCGGVYECVHTLYIYFLPLLRNCLHDGVISSWILRVLLPSKRVNLMIIGRRLGRVSDEFQTLREVGLLLYWLKLPRKRPCVCVC